MKYNLIMILFLFFFIASALGQSSEMALHFFSIGSIPNGDFGEEIDDNTQVTRRFGFNIGDKIGLAGSGYGAGIELISPVGIRGLEWIFSTKAIINISETESIQSDFRSELGDSVALELDYGKWFNLPVMSGFRYGYMISPEFTIYGILQAGVNFSKLASRKARIEKLTVEETEYDFARDFGFEIGTGILINQRYNIGFRYLNLSTPRFDGDQKLSETIFPGICSRENSIMGEERSISMFIITLGIQLFR